MDRRSFLAGATALLAAPLGAGGQQRSPTARLGYLGIARGPLADAFLDGIREFGYAEGQNLVVERRQYEGNIPRLPELAAELVRLKVDVIFATGPAPVNAVARATREIPLVAIDLESDPLEARFAKSLARPGGNITGVFLDLPELIGKWFEFLKTIVPKLSHVGVLWDPTTGRAQHKAASAAARSTGIRLEIVEVRRPDDFAAGFARIAGARVEALIQFSSPLIFLEAPHVADFAMSKRIPAISLFRVFPEAGGLMSYGPDIADLFRRCVTAGRFSGPRANAECVPRLPTFAARWVLEDPRRRPYLVFWTSDDGESRWGLKMAPTDDPDAVSVTLEDGKTPST
jgi:putative ABC transport system substrate-binding protein